jgi:primase-polymerase (primpol)-like protein
LVGGIAPERIMGVLSARCERWLAIGAGEHMSENEHIERGVLPTTLVEREQWLCWEEQERDGKPTKVPITPGSGAFASATDPETWTDLETAVDHLENSAVDGLGFVFTEEDPIVGVDLDDCRDPEAGRVDSDAREVVTRLDSYTEISPSGTGFHILLEGELPEGRNRKGTVEMYDSARFFTMTGDHVDVTPRTVEERQGELTAVHRECVQEPSMSGSNIGKATTETSATPTDVDLTDEELIERAQTAANGEKFVRLWRGNIHGYESQSEADMALCCLLAFWTGGDAKRIDQLFRRSGLLRQKWDDQHFADGATYGERTIERAINTTTDFYEPADADATDSPNATDSAGECFEGISSGSAEVRNTEVTEGSASRDHAYLREQNQILTAKLERREATIEAQRERIETLEGKLTELRASEASVDWEQPSQAEGSSEESPDESDSSGGSVWEKAKRLVDGRQ